MPVDSLHGFISKKQAVKRYRRSPRQLTRDITEAITLRDADTLPHLRLQTDDDKIHSAEDITLDRVKEFKAEGRNPMWFVAEIWMSDKFGPRGSATTPPPDEAPVEAKHTKAENTSSPESRGYSDDYVRLLAQQNEDLKADKDKLLNLVEELTENQKQNNVLLKSFQELLDGDNRLGGRKQASTLAAAAPAEADESENIVEAEVVAESRPKTKQSTKPKSRSTKSTATKKKRRATTKTKQKGFFETTTPTFYKLFNR